MALLKSTMTDKGIPGEYLRILHGAYVADGSRFQVRVGVYLNAEHRNAPNSAPLYIMPSTYDCAFDPESESNMVVQAYTQLKAGFPDFEGAEDC